MSSHVHGEWDAGGHCNKLVMRDGAGDTCGYRKPLLFADIVGYTGEVSEPNGPRIVGHFLADWADKAQERFEVWLEQHDADLAEDAIALAERGAFGHGGEDKCQCDSCKENYGPDGAPGRCGTCRTEQGQICPDEKTYKAIIESLGGDPT